MSRKTVELRKKLNQTRTRQDVVRSVSNGGRVYSGPTNPDAIVPRNKKGKNTWLKPGSKPVTGKVCSKPPSDAWYARLLKLAKEVESPKTMKKGRN